MDWKIEERMLGEKEVLPKLFLANARSLMRLHCLDILIFPLCTWLLFFAEINTDFII